MVSARQELKPGKYGENGENHSAVVTAAAKKELLNAAAEAAAEGISGPGI